MSGAVVDVKETTSSVSELDLSHCTNGIYLLHIVAGGQETTWKIIKKYQYEDFSAIKAYLKSGQMTLKDIIKDYRFKKVSSTWNIKDPMPGIKFFLWAIGHKIFR